MNPSGRFRLTAVRLACSIWTLPVAFIVGYIPLRYLWLAAAVAQNTTLSPNDIEILKLNASRVIGKSFSQAKYWSSRRIERSFFYAAVRNA